MLKGKIHKPHEETEEAKFQQGEGRTGRPPQRSPGRQSSEDETHCSHTCLNSAQNERSEGMGSESRCMKGSGGGAAAEAAPQGSILCTIDSC